MYIISLENVNMRGAKIEFHRGQTVFSFEVNSFFIFFCFLATVRPPPGFECKSLSSHMPMIDDPSILWSKTIDAGQYHG